MIYLSNQEKKISKKFLKQGYLIIKLKKLNSLDFIKKKIIFSINKLVSDKINSHLHLNNIHNKLDLHELNTFRVKLIKDLNSTKDFKYHYFNLAREQIYTLVGNELLMQKNINLSIQFPKDNSSLLPIHSDVWSGDSPFEINLWVPMVNCYKTKSMYILPEKNKLYFHELLKKKKIKSSHEMYSLIKKKLIWLKVNYGEALIFNQNLPHGNVMNMENETRISMNCRFKSYFSPFGDKKLGEFFKPITTRAMTNLGLNYISPFK